MSFKSSDLSFGATFVIQDGFSGALADAKKSIFDTEGALSGLIAKSQSLFSGLAIGTGLASAGVAIMSAFKPAIEESMAFEAQMSTVKAVSNSTATEMTMLADVAKELGRTTAFSAKEAAQGMEFFMRAGQDASDTAANLQHGLNLATAGKISLKKSADIATNALATFGLKADETSRVTDVMALAQSKANVSIESLGQSYKYAQGITLPFKTSIEETTAAIGLLGNAGLQGSVATRGLSTAFLRLADPTSKMTVLMDKLKKESDFTGFFDAEGEFVGVAGALEQLEKATAGLNPEKVAEVTSTLFGKDALKNIEALKNTEFKTIENGVATYHKGAEAIKRFTSELENSEGAAKRMADTQLDNLEGDIKLLDSAISGFKLSIGEALTPLIRMATQIGTKLVSAIASFMDTGFGKFLSKLIFGFGALLAGVGGVIAIFFAIKIAVAVLMPLFFSLASAVWLAIAPFLIIIAKVAIAIGILYALYKAFTEGSETVVRFVSVVLFMLNPFIGTIFALIGAYQRFVKVLSGEEPASNSGFIGFLQRIGGLMYFVKEAFSSLAYDAENGFHFRFDAKLLEVLDKLGIKELALNISTWVMRIQMFFRGIARGFMLAWNTIKEFATGVYNAFKPVIITLGDWTGLIDKNQSALSDWMRVGEYVAYVIIGVIGAIALSFAMLAIAAIIALAPIILTMYALYKVAEFVIDLFTDFENTLQRVQNFVAEILASITEFVSKFDAISNIVNTIASAIGFEGFDITQTTKQDFGFKSQDAPQKQLPFSPMLERPEPYEFTDNPLMQTVMDSKPQQATGSDVKQGNDAVTNNISVMIDSDEIATRVKEKIDKEQRFNNY